MGLPIPSARELVDGATSADELAARGSATRAAKSAREVASEYAEFTAEMTKSVVAGLNGATTWDTSSDAAKGFVGTAQVAPIRSDYSRSAQVSKAISELEMAKSTEGGAAAWDRLSKEWTLTSPISTGLVPFDLEAPAKLLTPRPTPLRNSIPRLKGQGASRRFKVISGFTGTGTGGITTTQPGMTEGSVNSTTGGNVGPGGLSYLRGPYISYAGYDVTLPYVTTSLSDSVSWQAEYQGAGFEDIRSLSNTALLYATMLLDERLMIYGRGSQQGYAGALASVSSFSVASVNASVAPGASSSLASGTKWVVVAPDAGDLLGTNGYAMHQGPSSTAASVAVANGNAIQVNIASDVSGALGYNLYIGSVSSGPFIYAGRTGYNIGYITSQPLTGPSVSASGADQSAVGSNYDGLLTNTAASGGYTTRLNAPFSTTNPGAEYQVAFGSLYESVKADPEEIWMNGFDRLQLSNAIINNAANSAYRVFIPNENIGGVKAGTVVQALMNEVTGTEIPITVHPWFPQGNSLIRQKTLPIPDSNVSETSVMVLPQDYVAVQWPVTQFTYDASTFEIGTMCHYAPAWNGLIQGIQGVGIGVIPPSFGDS